MTGVGSSWIIGWAKVGPRRLISGRLALALAAAAVVFALSAPDALANPDPFASCAGDPPAAVIACENGLPGTGPASWQVTGSGDPSIQGFGTSMSVNVGGRIGFKILTSSVAYHIDIYRLGYYGGLGARLIQADIQPSASLPQSQPPCINDASTGLIDCGDWSVSASWSVPADAVSGVYIAHLVRDDATSPQNGSQIVFVVRNDLSRSAVLVQTSDTTWEAYNPYGGNSLYQCTVGCPAGSPQGYKAAYAVSYNRPFLTGNIAGGRTWLYSTEYPMIRFLEENGYDVTYTSGVDVARDGALLLNHRVFMSSGHDEYWSQEQRDAVTQARDAGVNIAFFSGNEMFWKTRWQPSEDGSNTQYRTLVTYKETHFNRVVDPADPRVWTGAWDDPRFANVQPQNSLTGGFYNVDSGSAAITVSSAFSELRFWRNTTVANLAPGQSVTLAAGTIGYEWDTDADNGFRPPGLMDLSRTTVTGLDTFTDYGTFVTSGTGTATHSLTLYRAASGALVFDAGTIQWAWGLDADNPNHDLPDPTMQQATVNLLGDMGVNAGTLLPGLVPATPSSDTTPPTSTIASPTAGQAIVDGSLVTITGTATDAGGGVVAGVEVSTDGGQTWHPAQGTSTWSYSWIANRSPQTTILSRAVDDSGNLETPSDPTTVNIGCPCSLWGNRVPATPDSGDGHPIEVGVKFRSDVGGYVSAIRFYKSPANAGAHVADLWTVGGGLIARAVSTNETASGWQSVPFSKPVYIEPGVTYMASTFDPVGRYAATPTWFYPLPSPAPLGGGFVDSPPLHALRNVGGTVNGVYTYVYDHAPHFPRNTFDAANYWVDVSFSPGDPPPPVAVIARLVPLRVTGFTESVSRWQRTAARQSRSSRRRHRPGFAVGTRFTFTLSRRADVRIVFTLRIRGTKIGKRCFALTAKNRHGRPCSRVVPAGPTVLGSLDAGRHSVTFFGRLSSHRFLAPGSYTATVIAIDSKRQIAASRSLTFEILS